MNCEEIRSLLASWLDGELPQNTGRDVEAHVAVCHECRGIADAYRDMQQAFHGVEEAAQLQGSAAGQDNADLWQNVQMQIQAEENAMLRQEMEQMRQMLRELKAEVSLLRRQVNSSAQWEISRFDGLLPGMPAAQPATNLRCLL